jgi:hypothetical protein
MVLQIGVLAVAMLEFLIRENSIKIALVCLSFFVTTSLGFGLVTLFRGYCKAKAPPKIWKLTLSLFSIPILFFFFVNGVLMLGVGDRLLGDAACFGLVLGILCRLYTQPTGTGIVKLLVQQYRGKATEVWLDSTDLNVGDIKVQIAAQLGVDASRLSIESGKGSFLEDMARPFFSSLDQAVVTTDFFGFVSTSCYVYVKEEEEPRKVMFADDNEKGDKKNTIFRSLLALNKAEIKFNEEMCMTAKSPGAAQSKAFSICLCDKFAAAAPITNTFQIFQTMKVMPWDAEYGEGGDEHSEAGDSASVAEKSSNSGGQTKVIKAKSMKKSVSQFFKKMQSQKDKAVQNGDIVVLECDGK